MHPLAKHRATITQLNVATTLRRYGRLTTPALLRSPSTTISPAPILVPQSQRRNLRLAPPYLLDDHTPRYTLLTPTSASQKRSQAYAHLRNCNLCPRLCSVNRFERLGTCLIGADVKVGTIAPHFGEEPCIQGSNGSGSVFFSGCNLRCVFCQVCLS